MAAPFLVAENEDQDKLDLAEQADFPVAPDETDTSSTSTPTAARTSSVPGDWLERAKAKNPGVDDDALISFYERKHAPAPKKLPMLSDWMGRAQKANPDADPGELEDFWQEKYGRFGAKEKKPGFWESAGQGLKQGVQQLGSSAAGTFERLQNHEDQWHKVGSDVADSFDKEAAKFAPAAELSKQPWYQRMRDPEYLGNLFGNVAVQSAPSIGGAIVGGVLGGPAGAAAGMTAVTYFQQAGSTYREAFERYKKDGIDERDAHDKAYQDSGIAGLVSGVVNALAIPASLVAPFASTLKNLALQYTLNVAVDTGDQATQNVVAKSTYNPQQELSQGIPEAIVGSMGLSGPETMGAIKAATGKRTPEEQPPEPLPELDPRHQPFPKSTVDDIMASPDVDSAIAHAQNMVGSASGERVTDPGLSQDRDFARFTQQIERGGVTGPVGSAAGPDLGSSEVEPNALNQLIERGGGLPTQAELTQAAERTRTPFEPPILDTRTAQYQSNIDPGQAFTPRTEPEADPRLAIEAERNRLIAQRNAAIQRVTPDVTHEVSIHGEKQEVRPIEAPSKPLRSAFEATLPTVEQIHALAASKGLDANSPTFHEYSKMIVGKSKLDDMSPYELKQLADRLQKVSGNAPNQPVAKPKEKTEALPLPTGQTAAGEATVTNGVQKEKARLLASMDGTSGLPASEIESGITKTPALENNPDSIAVNSKMLSDFVVREPFSSKGFSGLDVPAQRIVMARVFDAAKNLKVRDAIIRSLPVDMMHHLRRQKLTPEMLFQNESVFGKSFISNSYIPVSIRAKAANAVIQSAARTTATFGQSVGLGASASEPSTTVKTGERDLLLLAQTPTSDATELDGPSPSKDPRESTITSDTSKARHDVAPSSDVVLGAGAASTASVPTNLSKPEPETNKKGSVRSDISHVQAEKAKLQKKPKAEQPDERYRLLPQKTRTSFEEAFTGAESGDRPSFRTLKEWLDPANKTLRAEFERRSGVKLPKGLAATNAAVEEYFKKPVQAETKEPHEESLQSDGFSLTNPTESKPKAKSQEQLSIDVPPTQVAGQPIIGREAQPKEAPTAILADALRQAADKIEGKKSVPKSDTAMTGLEDSGEKIGGSRKDKWAQRGLTMADLEGMTGGEEAKFIVKANIWKPDYAEMVKAGTDPKAAALVKIIYDRLAAKPEKDTPEGRRNYLAMMGYVKQAYISVRTMEDVNNASDTLKYDLVGLPRPNEMRGTTQQDREILQPKFQTFWSVSKGRQDPFYIGYSEGKKANKMVAEGFPNQEPWTRRYDIRPIEARGLTNEGAKFYAARMVELDKSGNVDELATTIKQAGAYEIREKNGRIVSYRLDRQGAEAQAQNLYENKSGTNDDAKDPVRPHLDELTREGQDYRNGKDVTAEDFRKAFGFRGIEFGNYAASDERQKHVNQAYDALHDLAGVLGIPPNAISLNGTLGLAFGARGSGKTAAHYEPGKMVINITKVNGPGALAHEWGHALDHYFGEVDKTDAYKGKARGASGWYTMGRYGGPSTRLTNLRPEMAQAFDRVMSTLFHRNVTKAEAVRAAELKLEKLKKAVADHTQSNLKDLRESLKMQEEAAGRHLAKLTEEDRPEGGYGKVETSFYKAAQTLSGPTGEYWRRPTEMFARSFEAYVFDRLEGKSDYLVHGVEADKFTKEKGYKANPYPAGVDRPSINAAFNHLFDTMQSKETDKGTALFDARDESAQGAPTMQQFKRAWTAGSSLGPGRKVIDSSEQYPDGMMEDLATRPYVRTLTPALDRVMRGMTARLKAKDPNFGTPSFVGLSPDDYYVGVNLRGPDGIVLNPWGALWRTQQDIRNEGLDASRTPEYMAARLLKTMVHELTHQQVEQHGGVFDKQLDANYNALGRDRLQLWQRSLINALEGSTDAIARDLRGQLPHWKDRTGLSDESRSGDAEPRRVFNGQDVADQGPSSRDRPGETLREGREDETAAVDGSAAVQRSDEPSKVTPAYTHWVTFDPSSRYLDKARSTLDSGSGFTIKRVYSHPTRGDLSVLEIESNVPYKDLDLALNSMSSPLRRVERKPAGLTGGLSPDRWESIYGQLVSDRSKVVGTALFSRREPTDDIADGGTLFPRPPIKVQPLSESGTIQPTTAREHLSAAKTSARPYLLGALGLQQIADVYGRDHPEVSAYNSALQTMQADFVQTTQTSDKILKDWDKLKVPVADQMAKVMEDSRFANFDPDPVKQQAALTPAQVELKTRFKAMPDEAKAVYRAARDYYTELAESRFQAIKDRINRAGGSPENRRKLVDRLQLAYEKTKAKVYFPFTRFGDHIVVAKKMEADRFSGKMKESDREVQAFNSPADASKFAMQMKARGWTVKQTTSKQYSLDKDGGASKTVREILDIVDEIGSDLTLPGMIDSRAQLKDAINQTFLNSMPDMSYAKHFIHAKEVKGASRDALRSFAHSALHGAHHISRIRHADKLSNAVMALDERINETEEGDLTEARQVYNELVQRHNTILNPNTHPFSAWLGQLGFTMSLGGVVATGVTNLTQVPLITLPWLGARFGFGKSTAALATAYKDFLDPATLNKDSLFDASKSSRLAVPERAMLEALQKRGRIDLTQTIDLSGRASQDNLSRVAKQTGSIQAKITKMLGATFHIPEVANRQVTALATYRLARESGATEAASTSKAEEAIVQTHFIYESSNRARYMSGNVLRVLTMFKQYSANIAFLYGRSAAVWLDSNNATPEERNIAKKQLLSMAGFQFAAAGALGMPFIGTVASLFTAVLNGFGDDDDKWDWEVELRKFLADQFGKEAGEVLSHGLSRLTPWDMAARLGQADLFFRAPSREREGRAGAMDWVTSFAGPVLGYGVNAYLGVGDLAKGIKDADAGHLLRGIEEMVPSVVRHAVKTLRYEMEGGLRTRDKIKQIDVGPMEKLGAFFGFQPSRIAELYEGVNAIRNHEHDLTQRRKELLDHYAAAINDRDADARRHALEEVRSFNGKNPSMRINGDTLMRSMKGRQQREKGTQGGVYLPRKREALRQQGDFANF